MRWNKKKNIRTNSKFHNSIIPYFTDPNVITISTQTHLQLHSYLVSFVSKILTFLETLSFERKSLPNVQLKFLFLLLFFTLWKVILTLSYVWMGVQEAMDPLIFKCVQFNNKALRLNSLFGTFFDGEFLHQSITNDVFFHTGWDEGVGLTSKTLLHWALNGLWQSHTRWWDLWWRPDQ